MGLLRLAVAHLFGASVASAQVCLGHPDINTVPFTFGFDVDRAHSQTAFVPRVSIGKAHWFTVVGAGVRKSELTDERSRLVRTPLARSSFDRTATRVDWCPIVSAEYESSTSTSTTLNAHTLTGELGLAVGRIFGARTKPEILLFANAGFAFTRTSVSALAPQQISTSAGPVIGVGTSLLFAEHLSVDAAVRLSLHVPGGWFSQPSLGLTIGRKSTR